MARESEMYRLKLEEILKAFPKKRVLSVNDICEYLGKSRHWCYDNLQKIRTNSIYTVEDLARDLCQ